MYAPLIYVSASLLDIIATRIIGAEFGFHTWTRVWNPNKNAAFRDQPYRTRKIISALHCGCVLLWKWTAEVENCVPKCPRRWKLSALSVPSRKLPNKYTRHNTDKFSILNLAYDVIYECLLLLLFFQFMPITDVSWHRNTAPRAQRVSFPHWNRIFCGPILFLISVLKKNCHFDILGPKRFR